MKADFIPNHLHNKRTVETLQSAGLITALTIIFLSSGHVPRTHVDAHAARVRRYVGYQAYIQETLDKVQPLSSKELKQESKEKPSLSNSFYASRYTSTPEVVETIMYVNTSENSSLNVRQFPDADSTVIGTLEYGAEVTVNSNCKINSFVGVSFNGTEGYVDSRFLSNIRPEPSNLSGTIPSTTIEYETENDQEDILVLNSEIGTVNGPSGKETYYNLNMSHIVEIMHDMGVEGEYWVREDGVKMLGKYVMVAADLSVHPRGSLVQTSLGVARVCDTGDFIEQNPHQLDVAVIW